MATSLVNASNGSSSSSSIGKSKSSSTSMNSGVIASSSSPRSPVSPGRGSTGGLAPERHHHQRGATRSNGNGSSNSNATLTSPASSMHSTLHPPSPSSPLLNTHYSSSSTGTSNNEQHHHHQQHQNRTHPQPPRFRQQQQHHPNDTPQFAHYPSPSAYSHSLSPIPSTSGLALTLSSSTGSGSGTTGSTSKGTPAGSSNGILSTSPNPVTTAYPPTIASMQHNAQHQPHLYPKHQYATANHHQTPSSSSSNATSPMHYPAALSSVPHSVGAGVASSSSISHQSHPHSNSQHHSNPHNPSLRLPRPSETFTRELSNVLQHTFIPSILPTAEEYQTKENARKYLEHLADRVTPGAKLLPFGSQANGLALRNSDMDLCYISPPNKPRKSPSELVELLGRMIEVEAPVFAVKMLSRARIPIIKLSPSPIYHLRKQEMEANAAAAAATALAASAGSSTSSPASGAGQAGEASMKKVSSSSAPPSAGEGAANTGMQTPSASKQVNGSSTAVQTDASSSRSPGTSASTSKQEHSKPRESTPASSSPTPPPSSSSPKPPAMPEFGLSCDIGFENRLALENTRLLLTYAMADPRLRTIVLFLKVWTKRRKINNPYLGTLSSYGYVLLVIHFLINVRKPPVLPNLQRLRPAGLTSLGQTEYEGRDIYFFDDLELLPRYWQSTNRDNVGELLIAFFHYYHKEFRYTFDVVSIRSEGGIINKAAKGWMSDQPMDGTTVPSVGTSEQGSGKEGVPPTPATPGANRNIPRDLNRLCIEDPFQTDYNVARTVTVDGLFTIRGEIARATGILRGTRSDVNAVIAELLEEREDYLVQAPPPNSNRRRSAPSPRLQPSVLATHQDFRTWALANGVPHAQGGNLPIFPSSHQLQGTSPLTGDNINGIQNNGLGALNAETLARYQQASQALSQANLQQQQAQQQQLLANLPALLAATNLSRSTRSTPRRFHEHSYKQLRQSGNGGVHGQQQQQGQQNIFGQQLLSPQQAQQVFANNQSFSQSIGHGVHPSKQAFSRSQNVAANNHLSRPPILERRSSWDGSAASDETRQQSFRRGSASVSEAGPGASSTSASDGLGNAPIDMGTTTAPTSPAMHNGTLPAFASHATYQPHPSTIASPTLSTVSVATAPAGSFNQYAPNQGRDRQNRNQRNQWPSSSSYNPRSPSQTSGIGGQHGKASRYYGSQDDGQFVTGTSIPMQSFPTTLPLATDFNAGALPMDYAARNDLGPSNSSALSTTSTSASLAASPLVNVEAMAGSEERDPIVDDGTIPSPSSIRFGNFDAAFYSSEPSDMAGLGLFDASSSTDGSPLSLSGGPAFDDSIIPEEVELPPPVRLPSQQPANFAASMRAAQRFRPQLADIPASPAAKHVPSPLNKPDLEESTSSRRPSLQSNRRKSAGDEVGLGLGDVTFFGKIPVSKNEGEREKAMAALLKETGRES